MRIDSQRQDDLFGLAQSAEPELFSERDPHLWPRERYAVMARSRLGQVLATLRSAGANPWTEKQAGKQLKKKEPKPKKEQPKKEQ